MGTQMSKYQALRAFLRASTTERVPMTFSEIEGVVGFKLPKSQMYPAWWSNNPTNNVMTNEWLAAGYKTEQVDIEGRKLVFRKVNAGGAALAGSDRAAEPKVSAGQGESGRDPLFGCMKDVTWIAPGVDLTEPADPEWADLIDDPNWRP